MALNQEMISTWRREDHPKGIKIENTWTRAMTTNNLRGFLRLVDAANLQAISITLLIVTDMICLHLMSRTTTVWRKKSAEVES